MMVTPLATAFARGNYLSLETFRSDGTGVRTPVWFALDRDGTLYLYTLLNSGKTKRVRRTAAVRVALCDMRGQVRGPWIDATASIAGAAQYAHGMALLDRKYWPWKKIGDLVGHLRKPRPRAVIAIRG